MKLEMQISKLSHEQYYSLLDALVECTCLQVTQRRANIINSLPHKDKIEQQGASRDVVMAILDVCKQYDDLFQDFFLLLEYQEQKSIQFLHLQEFVESLKTEQAEANGSWKNENCGGNPRKPGLDIICEEPLQEQTKIKQSYELGNPSKFDLTELIAECRNNLIGKNGLVGFALPCENYTFLDNFCQRLVEEFNTRKIKKQPHLSLNFKYNSVNSTIKLIQKCKPYLQNGDIIYPIQISNVSTPNQNITNLWQLISVEFKDNLKHRLIIIMWGSEDTIFPKGVIRLNSPQFTESHVLDWIFNVSTRLGWAEEVISQWRDKMIIDCLDESGKLHIALVYDHLNYAIDLLKQKHSEQAFLKKLEERIYPYV